MSEMPEIPKWTPKVPWKHKLVRVFRVERWRIIVLLRYYRGLGAATFEFEFRFGKPPKMKPEDWADMEPDWSTYEQWDFYEGRG